MPDCVAEQKAELGRVLDPLLRGTPGVALLDFPAHPNVGDSAIWLGERALLRSIGAPVRYCADLEGFDPEACRAALPDGGVILLHGGGNLGDVWPRHQEFRERVIRSFPDIPILQLPQTIHFAAAAALERARRTFDAHPRLTLLARDNVSGSFARANFSADSRLCPDSAVALAPLPRPLPPRVPVVWNSRSDIEHPGARPPSMAGRPLPSDWLAEREGPLVAAERVLRHPAGRLAGPLPWLSAGWGRLLDSLARARVDRGCRMLAEGRLVVTNRLHGHLLCLMMGIPHYLSDNGYGKLRWYFDTWTRNSPLATWCESEEEALERASR